MGCTELIDEVPREEIAAFCFKQVKRIGKRVPELAGTLAKVRRFGGAPHEVSDPANPDGPPLYSVSPDEQIGCLDSIDVPFAIEICYSQDKVKEKIRAYRRTRVRYI